MDDAPNFAVWPSPAERATRIAARIKGFRFSLADEQVMCAARGLDLRIWRRAAFGRVVCADAHLAICDALTLEPIDARPPVMAGLRLAGPVCWATLGAGVKVTREMRGHTSHAAAALAGVSVATVSRCEAGQVLSFDSLARLAAYVGLHPHDYTVAPAPAAPGSTGNTHCNPLTTQEARHV